MNDKRIKTTFIPKACYDRKAWEDVRNEQGEKTGERKEVDVKATFSGELVIYRPTIDERYEFAELLGLDVSKDGEVVQSEGSVVKMMRNLLRASEKFYAKVALKRLSDGQEFKSFEELSVDPDCEGILIEVGMQIKNGFRASKNA